MSVLRSYLFAPGNRDDLLEKVFGAGADAVVLDLEDAVPAAHKRAARSLVARALERQASAAGPRVFVRINPVAAGDWEADLRAVVLPGLCGVRLPKAECPDEVASADALLGRLEAERGLSQGRIELALTIESAVGLDRATELARASPRVGNLCFGAADFVADISAEPSPDEVATLFARSQMVVSSRLAGLDPPIASVHTSLDDDDGLLASCVAAPRLGFFGRSCVHPRQVPIVNAAFEPQAAAVAQARETVDRYREAESSGVGAAAFGGEFVDRAVLRRAEGLLALARRFGEQDPE